MQLKKVMKKIVALGIGSTMVGATILGAMAADLSQYPHPFVQDDGSFNGMIVVGEAAQTGDVLGAIDIAASLQYSAKVAKPLPSSESTESVTIEKGEKIQKGSEDFSLGDKMSDVVEKFDSDEFPVLMEDGTVEDDDGTDVDYEQEVTFGDAELKYGNPDDDFYDEPVPYIDFAGASEPVWTYHVHFKEDLNISALDDGEKITLFGKEYTFDPDNENTGEITLFGSDKTVLISQGETVTVNVDGKDYEISVLGGNSDKATAIVRVGSETKTLSEGDSRTLGGLDIYVDDVFISNIGTSQVSVNIFVGSQKVTLPEAGSEETLEIDDDDVDGITANVTGDSNGEVTDIYFKIDPTQYTNPDTHDDFDWLAMDKSFEETDLFNFKLDFDSVTPALKSSSDTEIKLDRSGSKIVLDFTNNNGDSYSLDLYDADKTNDAIDMAEHLKVVSAGNILEERDIFILAEDETNDPLTRIYKVENIDDDPKEVELKELMSGKTVKVSEGDEIDNTGVKVDTINGRDNFTLDSNTLDYVYTKYDMKITFDYGNDLNTAVLTLEEDINDDYTQDVTGDTLTVNMTYDSDDDEIDISSVKGTTASQSTEDNDIEYTLTTYGTYAELDTDNNDKLEIWYPKRDRFYNVFFAPVDAAVKRTTSGSSGGVYYETVKIDPGASVLDTEISNYKNKNLIVVGGPAANRAAAALLGLEFPAYGEASTIPENAAIIKLIENGEHVSVLVAGWEADDTRRACRVLADYQKYQAEGKLTGKEVRITGTSLSDISVQTIE